MIYIGNHVSFSKGYLAMGQHEKTLGGNTFAFFTRNPRGGKTKPADPEDMRCLRAFLRSGNAGGGSDVDAGSRHTDETAAFGPLVAHAPYTMNLCSRKPEIREYARTVFQEDLSKMELLAGPAAGESGDGNAGIAADRDDAADRNEPSEAPDIYLNFHPGSHTGLGAEAGIRIIADVLNESLSPYQHTVVLLETMAGKGTEIGRSFEELADILRLIRPELRPKTGVCLDTCHVWDAGYDIGSDLDGVLTAFDAAIGLDRLYAVHLNDSLNPRGSRKDRHAKLGQGCIGKAALARVIRHPALQGRPFILETPNDDAGYAAEIAWVKGTMLP